MLWSSATAWWPSLRRSAACQGHRNRRRMTVLPEETEAAYDRVGLTAYTQSWDGPSCAARRRHTGDSRWTRSVPGHRIDRAAKGWWPAPASAGDDALVLATGSYAFVPPVPGHDLPGRGAYRTLDDLDAIRADAAHPRRRPHPIPGRHRRWGCWTGSGERAEPFGMTPHVVECAPRLMARSSTWRAGAVGQDDRRTGNRRASSMSGPLRSRLRRRILRVRCPTWTLDRRRAGDLCRRRPPAR